ncbi:MAG: UDP-N-acetylmuramoyl-tripeptide--D-alanyl-D-alanine ligase [Chloroflexota bacterium]
MLTVADIFDALSGLRPSGAEGQVVVDATVDSRTAISGAMFVALPGERLNGHDFVDDAFENGACLAIIQRDVSPQHRILDLRLPLTPDDFQTLTYPLCLRVEDSLLALQRVASYWRRKIDVRVIGITGSVGKSTTKEVTARVLSQRYSTLKNPGNLNNEIGLPLTVLQLTKNHQRAVLEMGLYVPGEIALLCDIALPHVGVVTNVGTVHAERAGSQEAIARGKAELLRALPPAPAGVAVLNYDDLWVRGMAEQTKARVFFYGLDPQADLWADGVEGLGLDGIRFRLHYGNEILHLRIPMLGRHSVHTALRAAAVGLIEGLSWQEIVSGLRSSQVELRLVAVRAFNGAIILDDTYNASPDSVLAALNLLSELDGRKVAVLGDMLELGPYERQGHTLVGIRAADVADVLITVGLKAQMIAEAAQQAGLSPKAIEKFDNNQQAIDWLKEHMELTDVVLVKGSHGMRMDCIVESLEARP